MCARNCDAINFDRNVIIIVNQKSYEKQHFILPMFQKTNETAEDEGKQIIKLFLEQQ